MQTEPHLEDWFVRDPVERIVGLEAALNLLPDEEKKEEGEGIKEHQADAQEEEDHVPKRNQRALGDEVVTEEEEEEKEGGEDDDNQEQKVSDTPT